MACTQTLNGIAQECAANLAGIREAYIANIDDVSAITVDESAHTVSSITMDGDAKFMVYKFNKQTGSLTSNLTKNEQNGVMYWSNEINLQFNKQEAVKHLEISALAAGQLAVIILDNNGKYWYCGYDGYVSATTGVAQSGQSFDDLNGYTLTMSSMSAFLPFEMTKAQVTAIIDAA